MWLNPKCIKVSSYCFGVGEFQTVNMFEINATLNNYIMYFFFLIAKLLAFGESLPFDGDLAS